MLIPKGEQVELGRRGALKDVLQELSDAGFTGYVEVSYKLGELSRGYVVLDGGRIVLAGITRLVSKKEVLGKEALDEMLGLESCVVDVYSLPAEKVAKAIEWNRKASVGLSEALPKAPPSESEEPSPEDRERLLEKYGIKEPSPEEIDHLIKSALEEETSPADFSTAKEEMLRIADRYLGKLSKKVVRIIESCNSLEELVEKFPEIESAANSLVIFVPRKKIDEMLDEMRGLLGVD